MSEPKQSETPRTDAAHKTEDIQTIYEESQKLERENQRLLDLVRHQRAELHEEGLITDPEYADLAGISGSVARLEAYDSITEERDQWKACAQTFRFELNKSREIIESFLGDGTDGERIRKTLAAFDKLNTP